MLRKTFDSVCESDWFHGLVTKSKSLETHEMRKPKLNLSYHEQDGVLLPNICISNQPEDEQPSGDTVAWRLLICGRIIQSGMLF